MREIISRCSILCLKIAFISRLETLRIAKQICAGKKNGGFAVLRD